MVQTPTPELIKKHDRPGPRYTSYPPAPAWSEAFGPDQYAERLARANAARGPLSVYVHLPFCVEMCRYCGCNVIATKDHTRADRYLDVLEREVEMVAERLPDRRLVSQLHYGGGTPTFLDVKQLDRLYAILGRHFEFAKDAEKAIEVDPVVTTQDQVELLAKLGFNRISMGVQDLDPRVQEAVARVQSEAETARLIGWARAAGFKSVNVDMMYGLPRQTLDSWRATIEKVVAMKPDRLAIFGYAHVPWAKPHQRLLPVADLPGPELRVQLFLLAAELLGKLGYRQIGLDHFALETDELARAQDDGTLFRNFQGYSHRCAPDTVAFGVTAISDVGGAFAQNDHRLNDWTKKVLAGELPIERGAVLSDDDQLRRFAITQLMCLFRLDLREVEKRFGKPGRDALAGSVAKLAPLEGDGIVKVAEPMIEVLPLGRLLVRNVAMAFDAYLKDDGSEKRFSRTV